MIPIPVEVDAMLAILNLPKEMGNNREYTPPSIYIAFAKKAGRDIGDRFRLLIDSKIA